MTTPAPTFSRPVGTISLYCCGGGGANIGREYVQDGHSGDVAKISTYFIDTSDSNLDETTVDKAWLFEDLDGSGKIRNSNDKAIAKAIPNILRKFAPGDLNIVVFTTSGGTGSVSAPLLIKQLLEEGHQVIGVAMGSHESIRAAENTIGTIKTLDAISRHLDTPVVVHFGMNSPTRPRSEVDTEAHLIINGLSLLCSRRNHGLDTADIKSLLQFNISTDVPAQLARIHLFDDREAFEKEMSEPIAAAYLKRDHDDLDPDVFVPYSCEGFMPAILQSNSNLYFGIENKSFADLAKELEALKKEMDVQKKTRSQAVSFASEDDEVSDTGLIF